MFPLANGPAQNLDELYRTLRPEPLIDPAEFALFYRPQVNKVRGEDTVARLSKKLEQSYRTLPFKAFLMGHPGVGKSTEVSRLLTQASQQRIGVRLSIATELNPACFKVFDVLVLMLIRLTEEAKNKATLLDSMLSATLVTEVTQWFGTEVVKNTSLDAASTSVEAGAGIKDNSLWAGLLGIFASVKGEIKYAADRKTETIEYRLHRLPALVDICNRLIEVCSRILWEKEKKEWILIVEDLDKTGISPDQLQPDLCTAGGILPELS